MQNVMHIATNAGHTAQNNGRPRIMLAATHLMFAKEKPPGDLPTPLLEKTLLSRNDKNHFFQPFPRPF